MKKPWSDLSVQLNYAWRELTGPYRGTLDHLKQQTDVAKAVYDFEATYEVSGHQGISQRTGFARDVLNRYGKFDIGTTLKGVGRDQIAKVHEGEIILRKDASDAIRDIFRNGAFDTPTAFREMRSPSDLAGQVTGAAKAGGKTVHLNIAQGAIVIHSAASADGIASDLVDRMVTHLERNERLSRMATDGN